jgi:nucleolar protein 9
MLQVILEVAPDTLYDEIFIKVLRSSFLEISSHHCGNFVIQALISSARHKDQVCAGYLFFG